MSARNPQGGRTSRLALYRRFMAEMRLLHRVCEACGRTPKEAGQKKLFPHHLLRVEILGVDDPLLVHPGNILMLCNDDHALFHPGRREYNWLVASKKRGGALR